MALHTLIAQIHALDPLTVRATIVLGNSNWQKKKQRKNNKGTQIERLSDFRVN